MSVRVWQSCPPDERGLYADWEVECSEHTAAHATCADWTWAMEAAWGHIAMHHHRPPCAHEYGWYVDGRPEDHKCLDCGTPLPEASEEAS
jgi:hypothetical protein